MDYGFHTLASLSAYSISQTKAKVFTDKAKLTSKR